MERGSQTGNPIQSHKVNKLIAAVERHETRGTGADPKKDRAFLTAEYRQILELLRMKDDKRAIAMMNFQHHLIARMDDVCHVRKNQLVVSPRFPHLLNTKIAWSKNVKDESNCPWQIILPDMDPTTCVYMSLALFLEEDLQFGDGVTSQWLFVRGMMTNRSDVKLQDKKGTQGKERYSRILKKCTDDPAFERIQSHNDRLGSHSIRKTALTRCREQGCPRDDLDY